MLQRWIPTFIFSFQLTPRCTTRPALLQLSKLGFGFRDESDDVEGRIAGNWKDEEVFVWT
jgi:hypothetical protein